jgi:hypothetical protein
VAIERTNRNGKPFVENACPHCGSAEAAERFSTQCGHALLAPP